LSLSLDTEDATLALGAKIALHLRVTDVVFLTGALGAGKTTLARGLIRALTEDVIIPSPTYTLIQTYTAPAFDLWHCDFYRLEQPDEILELGILDFMDTGVSLIEWPEKMGAYRPEAGLQVDLGFSDTGRLAVLTGDPSWEARLEKF